MSLVPSARLDGRPASHDLFGRLAGRAARLALMALGGLLVILGALIAPLPGPMGLPVAVVGMILILRNSYRARRAFIRAQRAHPRLLHPIRRLLRRRPEVAPVAWQMVLRLERLLTPRRYRMAARARRPFRRRNA
ncbi:hypothetical protein [Phenylobacterium sp.]|uniref:hypothetical protein n=1 Tax=Phenylobacterium sp. TaxID=1871053 RepID=UPI003FA76B60